MLDLLRLYIQVIEEQSFTAVARRMGISQPAVSNQIKALEDKLAVKLIDRKGKGLILTPQGEIVLQHAYRLIEEWNHLKIDLESIMGQVSGLVHIGASHIPGEYLLPFQLASLQREYPKIKFKITIGDSLEIAKKISAQEVDFGVVGAVFNTEYLASEFWLNDELQLVVSQDHVLSSYSKISIKDLLDYPMIARESGSGHQRALEEGLIEKGFRPEDFKIGLELSSTEAVKNAVRSGLGYSFLSLTALHSHLREGLSVFAVEDIRITRGFYLLKRRNMSLSLTASLCYHYLKSLVIIDKE